MILEQLDSVLVERAQLSHLFSFGFM